MNSQNTNGNVDKFHFVVAFVIRTYKHNIIQSNAVAARWITTLMEKYYISKQNKTKILIVHIKYTRNGDLFFWE